MADNADAPEWVEMFPPGPAIKAVDGRSWTLDLKTVISAFKASKTPLVVDYEHAQHHLAAKGEKAPAVGWIIDLEERNGGLWAHIEWTAAASKMIVEREYRFISPDFRHRADGMITRLSGAGLVNRPALEMTALSRMQETELPVLPPFWAVQEEAQALAAQAHTYREEQARLGFTISIVEAVAVCSERNATLSKEE